MRAGPHNMRAGGGGEEEPVTKHLEKLLGRQVAEMRARERPEQHSVVQKRPGESAPGHRARRSPHNRARCTEPVALWAALSRSAQPSCQTTRNNNSRRGRCRAPVVACHDTRDENLALRGREKFLREHLFPKIVALRARKWHIATCSVGVVRPFHTCCSARHNARVASGACVPLKTVVDSLQKLGRGEHLHRGEAYGAGRGLPRARDAQAERQ